MQYTVSSRGRPIGVTDLGFCRIGGPSRSGWFHPNAEGERLMPVVASVIPAMRAFVHRDVLDDDGRPTLVQPHLLGSSLFADLAEALHHAEALELTLHREDGTLIATTLVGIQDTEQLRALAEWDDAFPDDEDPPSPDEEAWCVEVVNDELPDDAELALDADPSFLGDLVEDGDDDRADDDEPTSFPRYQIHVVLADPADVP